MLSLPFRGVPRGCARGCWFLTGCTSQNDSAPQDEPRLEHFHTSAFQEPGSALIENVLRLLSASRVTFIAPGGLRHKQNRQ